MLPMDLLGRSRSSCLAILAVEALNTSGCIHNLVLAREERMAVRADIDLELGLYAAGLEHISTSAGNLTGSVLWMN